LDPDRRPAIVLAGHHHFAEPLGVAGYRVVHATSDQAVRTASSEAASLVLVDASDGSVNGIRALRRDPALAALPIIALTASDGRQQERALEAGADDALAIASGPAMLLARIRTVLKLAAYRRDLEGKARDLSDTTGTLYSLIGQQVDEPQSVAQLRRFLSPQLAEMVLSAGGTELLRSHRRDVGVVFCDLRGFTAFAEAVSPDEVMTVLGDFHTTLGRTIFEFGATVERFAGDAIMAFLNDPVPCPDPPLEAVRMALAMRERVVPLTRVWRDRGYELGLGIGVAFGPATLGTVGFEDRIDYAAIGPVTNLAARLCAEARGGEVLVSGAVRDALGDRLVAIALDALRLKGFREPVPAYRALGLSDALAESDDPPSLRSPVTISGRRADRKELT
jgi:adenylate cyclase